MANHDTILNNRYKLLAQQGSGGMAVIYKATDLELGRTVAIKALRPSLTAEPSFLMRFRNEARSIANLQHPNIVTLFDVRNDGQTQYLVMEFVEGPDLKKIIKQEGVLNIDRVLKLAIQICAGIGYAHRAGLVHADVKPQNILITKGDVVKVTDFGIAQALSDTQPGQKVDVVWGSPHYFAPEQARGERPTPASDVYAIGIVMFEMLTGRLPFVGASQQELAMAHLRERVPLVSEFNPSIPDSLAQIVFKVMSKEPAARYRTADQLGLILESYQQRGKENTMSQPSKQQPANPHQQYTAPPPQSPLPYSQGIPAASQQRPPQQDAPLPFTQAQQPDPTQRYSAVPEAPQQPGYNRPVQSPFGGNAPAAPQGSSSRPVQSQQWTGSDSNPYANQPSQQLYSRQMRNEAPATLDMVTILLAILAFFAVACLIPLYIAVFQARFGG